jgi:hypothetical protein
VKAGPLLLLLPMTFSLAACVSRLDFLFFFSWWMMEKLGKDAFSSRADDDYDGRK